MNDIEEAIKHFNSTVAQLKYLDNAKDGTHLKAYVRRRNAKNRRRLQASRVALEELLKAETNKGCKHCQNADKIWAVDSDGVMEVEKGGEHCFPYIAVENDTFGTADLFSINYCPMCGNKL